MISKKLKMIGLASILSLGVVGATISVSQFKPIEYTAAANQGSVTNITGTITDTAVNNEGSKRVNVQLSDVSYTPMKSFKIFQTITRTNASSKNRTYEVEFAFSGYTIPNTNVPFHLQSLSFFELNVDNSINRNNRGTDTDFSLEICTDPNNSNNYQSVKTISQKIDRNPATITFNDLDCLNVYGLKIVISSKTKNDEYSCFKDIKQCTFKFGCTNQ